jgi:molybdate transport repressor ModE-like protein
MRFDLVDLRLFVSVVEQGSLTRGARAMNLALASASERISGMEDVLGAQLLERTRRGVQATAAGTALVRHARLILFQVEQMRGELRFYGTGVKGRIKVLCNTAAMVAFLPRPLCGFLLMHPDLSVDLEERPSAEIALAVADGRADLGIAADAADLGALQTRPFAQDRLIVAASARHAIASRRSVAFAEIIDQPFVGLSDAALEIHLAERAQRQGHQLDYRIRLRRAQDVGSLVAAGVGLAILSDSSIGELDCRDLAIIPLDESWAHRHLYLCARDFQALTPPADLLARHLTAEPSVRP